MTVHFLAGDLFLSGAQVLAHGVNCRGRMGAGIAQEFKRRWPRMFKEYRRRCHVGALVPGGMMLWCESTPWILNLATQDTSGGARLDAVDEALASLALNHQELGIRSVAMPQVAAGLGGLDWSQVRAVILARLAASALQVYVYETWVEGLAATEPPQSKL